MGFAYLAIGAAVGDGVASKCDGRTKSGTRERHSASLEAGVRSGAGRV
jgi:hypothetical protein